MKKTIIFLLAIATMMSLSAQQYALHFGTVDGPVVAAGDTVEYTTTNSEMNTMHMAFIYLYIENLTEDSLSTDNDIVMVEGPEGLVTELCAGGNCPQQGAYTLAPGNNPEMPLTIEPHLQPEYGGETILYSITVGNARTMANAVTIYLKVNISETQQGIDAANATAAKIYPNPTHGKVTVGEKEYDLSGRAAGVYYLPVEGGVARVIKL